MNGGTALRAGAGALALVLLASLPVAAGATPQGSAPPAAKDGPLSPRLAVLAGRAEARADGLAPSADLAEGINADATGRLYVDVRITGPDALAHLDALPGVEVEATTPDGEAATLAVPRSQLGALAAVDGLSAADEVPVPHVDRTHRTLQDVPASASTAWACPSGPTVSSGSAQLGVPTARSTFGVQGDFVKVGIISDSYGADAAAAAADVQTGELPGKGNPCGMTAPVQIVADAADGTDEGRAMAQIVHDLAPNATLAFADMGVSQIEMANHVRALRDAGARVIVDDITYFDETIYQDGYLAAAIDEVVADGVTYLSSAGNMNLTIGGRSVGSYETQAFRPTACPAVIGSDATCHDFDPGTGVSAKDVVTVPAGGSLALNLGWNEAVYDVGTDLDLYLLDDATGSILDLGATDSIASGRPIEWAVYDNEGRAARKVRIVVANYGNVGTPRFKSVLFTPGLTSVQWSTAAGGDVFGPTLFGHAGADATVAVAAMTDTSTPSVEPFSSRGPATSCWQPVHGSQHATAKPSCTTKTVDVAATDGVATSVSGFDPFYGTSAAAPHVAAVAALMAARSTCASPSTIRAALTAGAAPLAGGVHAAGSGRTRAVNALQLVDPCPGHGLPFVPTIGAVTGASARVTAAPPADRSSNPVGYELQVVRPGGAVVDTLAGAISGPGPNATVDVPVSAGGAYRVKARFEFEATGWTPWSPSSALIVPPFSSASAFMSQLGRDFASRSLTDEERQVVTFALTDDYGPAESIAFAAQLDPWGPKIDPVIRLFYAYFGRKPDPSGLDYWLGRRRSGVLLDKISSTFAASSEFKNTYGTLSNSAFVKRVYLNVLGRPGDAGGTSYWTKQLDLKRKNRGQVMTGFSESSEHLRRRFGEVTTVDLYFGMLRRIPTAAELADWGPVVAADLESADSHGTADLIGHLLASTEYRDRVS